MQAWSENQFYRQFTERLVKINRERNVELSEYSEQLLFLSIIGWFEDPILFKPGLPRNNEELIELGVQVYQVALEQPHIRIEMERRGRVSYGALLVSLGDAGRIVLNELSETGF